MATAKAEATTADEKGEARRRRTCLVVLMGLPGAGKSTFARKLAVRLREWEDGGKDAVVVSYDEVVSRAEQARMASEAAAADETSSSEWKNSRARVVASVRKFIGGDEDGKEEEEELDASLVSSLKSQCRLTDEQKDLVVIVDDNNYYSSMRYEYFRLARSAGAGFCQVHLTCTSAQAAEANSSRPEAERLPARVAEAMFARMEPPRPAKNAWEKFSFSLSTFDKDTATRLEEVPTDLIASVVELALSNPESDQEIRAREDERERGRVACSASVIHQVDKILRKKLNSLMLEEPVRSLPREAKRAESLRLNSARTEVLEDLRTGFARLPREVVRAVEAREKGAVTAGLTPEVDAMFRAKMNAQESTKS